MYPMYKQFITPLRRGWDSNPRKARAFNGFRDRPVQPLRHLSIRNINISAFSYEIKPKTRLQTNHKVISSTRQKCTRSRFVYSTNNLP